MYGLMALISMIVRQFFLPNPFECFGDKADGYNLMAGLLIHPIAFFIVGLMYDKGSEPAQGNFLYLITYLAIAGILMLMSIFEFAKWWIFTIIAAVIVFFILAVRWKERIM